MFTYSSSSSDVDSYFVKFSSDNTIETSTTTFIPSQDLPNGTYTLQVRAKDQLGNLSGAVSKSVEIYSIPSGFDVKTLPDIPGGIWQTNHQIILNLYF